MGRVGWGLVAAWAVGAAAPAAAAPCDTSGPDLVVDGITCQLGGVHTFDSVVVKNGGVIEVPAYDGADRVHTGNLELRALSITVEAGSTITAKGKGYQAPRCGNGDGPVAGAGGVGGCAVRDSGGGGAHFGAGGRGTKDCFVVPPPDSCQFPDEFSEDCGNSLNAAGTACSDRTDCRDFDGEPAVGGTPYPHSIYEIEFGAAGGDKGCRDGDGFGRQPNVAGPGGGRIVLAAPDGTVTIDGTIDANGRRGCGTGNDSAGGGAGGSILIAGQSVRIGPAAIVTARGGLGGDTQGLAGDPTGECAAPAQQGGTCDDCGGGGGGGIISVLSVTASIEDTAIFDVDGGLGGTCPICRGEAGGGAGELQIDGAYVGEFCDGYDNDFDGEVDEDLPPLPCGMPSCVGGVPQTCPPDVPACIGPVTDTRPRFVVVVDTSGSMLTDPAGRPTFGDGSLDHPGADVDGDGLANDSKLFQAKQALSSVIAAYPEIDFALARYHQDEGIDRSCQLAHWFECHDICCTYDDPRDNAPPPASPACSLDLGASGVVSVDMVSSGDECIHYAGSCGPPERGADVLVGFGADINQYLMWLDHAETNFVDTTVEGDYCDFAAGGDCELRGTGPTPLAGSLQAAKAYLAPQIACDGAAACRTYAVILLTDGAESCRGDPVAAAADLRASLGVDTFVVGFSVVAGERAELDAIAMAGSGGARGAFFAGDESELANALAAIVGGSIVTESCNGADDDCDGLVDEDFPDLGAPCDDGELGACRGTGTRVCAPTGDGTECAIADPGATPVDEVCNGLDDDCDGLIDEDLSCVPTCTPTGPDVCDGVDNDCDGAIDEDDPSAGSPCGTTDVGVCNFGVLVCVGGNLVCVGAIEPGVEICNGLDDDCDGEPDDAAPCPGQTSCVGGGCRIPCAGGEFDCPPGLTCVDDPAGGRVCLPDPCAACGPGQVCAGDTCIDPCDGVECDAGETCVHGNCFDCHVLGCDVAGQVCFDGECVDDPCAGVDCGDGASCVRGQCVADCDDSACPAGQRCGADGRCADDPCAGVDCPLEGDVCVDGACVDDPCGPVTCAAGQVCAGGRCVADPCPLVDCSAGRHCVVLPSGDPRCVDEDARVDRVYAAGGGCACRAGAESGPPASAWLVVAVAFACARRRRR
ncbi:MAG: VWA domain-containing protein [Deltaproteobacteria bacterium]|nr:MAG: VWA domain-containing protein [Deltaproteobacteria bacterium]